MVLEGFHALKHALRFNATIEAAWSDDLERVRRLAGEHAPDVDPRLAALIEVIGANAFARLSSSPIATGVIAIARRPDIDLKALLAGGGAPVVLLDHPSHLGNLGAVIRVAAAADIAGVVTTGPQDPWHPAAIRGAAGLHFALPVGRIEALPDTERPLIAIDLDGPTLTAARVPDDAILAFGNERRGLSPELRACAAARLTIPMRAGVSSLNLATAVAVVLYAGRLRS